MDGRSVCDSYPAPPPPNPYSNPIDDFLKRDADLSGALMSFAFSGLLGVLLVWHVGQAFAKRLWLLPSHPSRILALNAGTLALLGIVAPKPPNPGSDTDNSRSDESRMLQSIVLICGIIGAFMPSFAASTDLHDMWSNVTGVQLLVLSVNFLTFLQLFYIPDGFPWPTIHETATEHKVAMISLFLLSLVLLIHALVLKAMMSDMTSMVSQRLDHLCAMDAKPGWRAWTWEVVEQNTYIKLMMALTSSPQNVISRSPSAAIVGALVLLCVIILFLSKIGDGGLLVFHFFQRQAIVVCAFICVWRWVRGAMQEDRSFWSLVFAPEPSYWSRRVQNLQHTLKAGPHSREPNALEEGQWGFKEVLWYTAAFFMLHVSFPLHRLLVALIRFAQILSAALAQRVIRLPANSVVGIVRLCRARFQKSCRPADAVHAEASSITSFISLGVVCLEGEDAHIVGREFTGAANRIVKRQLKKAQKRSNLKQLISHLQSFDRSKFATGESKAIHDALNQEGTPFIGNMFVKHHGYQFGWRLTALSLLKLLVKIEVTVLGKSVVSENAIIAYWQAMNMMQLVDEQFVPCRVCSKDIYASACTFAWSKLQKKKRRWTEKRSRVKQDQARLDAVDRILKATLEPTKRHIEELVNEAQKSSQDADNHVSAWPQQVVISYTMYTLCQNLLTCWTGWTNDEEAASMANGRGEDQESSAKMKIEGMVDHIKGLIGEVMACCLSNLPTAVDMSTTEAVQSVRMSEIERALVLNAHGKHLWKELQWPTLYSHRDTGLGQLKHWIHS